MSTASSLIYLDNNATTRVDPAVVEEMLPWLAENYGNPSSGYRFGQKVNDALEMARERVGALLAANPGRCFLRVAGRRARMRRFIPRSRWIATGSTSSPRESNTVPR